MNAFNKRKLKRKVLQCFWNHIFLIAVCVGLYVVYKRKFYIGIYLYLLALLYVGFKLTEFLRPKEYEGEVTYFNVRTEQVKKTIPIKQAKYHRKISQKDLL
jgi:hypothetical protein